MNTTEFLGYLGAFLSAITFVPQVWQAWKTKSVGDLSTWMILIVISSTVVWLIYAFSIQSGPVMAANTVVLAMALLLLYFKFTFKAKA
ncbi:MAG: PQ-loop repeat-containing protein [Sphingobacteriia bacterium]|nr:MAG: PQ-loop repeat-containing protein [Sphingobacteriia bacterium]